MSEDGDGGLVRRCREGDRRAFEGLVIRYERPVYNAALRMLRDAEDARDVTQVVFLKAFEHLGDYDPRYRFYSWIYRIALNESINLLNRRMRVEPVSEDTIDDEPGPDDVLGREQTARSIEAALMTIRPEYRSVIVLRHLLECGYHDMSVILELPEKTIKSRLYTARQLLKDALLQRGKGHP